MAIRSTIWIKNEYGKSFTGIYCYFDGHLSHNGKILLENYTNKEIVRELINHGELFCLKENIHPKEGIEHSFDNKQDNVCVFYHRDMGEKMIKICSAEDLDNAHCFFMEYNYFFIDNEWYLCEDEKLLKLKDLDFL